MDQQHDVSQILHRITRWLDRQDTTLSQNLRSPQDAIRLYDYWQSHLDRELFPSFADTPEEVWEDQWDEGETYKSVAWHRRMALGYDPLDPQPEDSELPEGMLWFRFHWKTKADDGSNYETGAGKNVEDAFTRLGYGGGAMAALDYYEQVPSKNHPHTGI